MGAAGLGQTQAFKLKQITIKKARSAKGYGKFSGGTPSRPINKMWQKTFRRAAVHPAPGSANVQSAQGVDPSHRPESGLTTMRSTDNCSMIIIEQLGLYAICQENSKFWLEWNSGIQYQGLTIHPKTPLAEWTSNALPE
jgi:hypothetical protein